MSEPVRLWSVTSLIKEGLGTSEPLVKWAVTETAAAAVRSRNTVARMIEDEGEEAAVAWLEEARWRSSGKAKIRGTDLHNAAEQLALGARPIVDATVLPYVEQYERWLRTHSPRFLMAEAPVYNVAQHYAGTLDGVVELPGRPKPLLYDIKTTQYGPNDLTPKGHPRRRPPFPEVALQLVAYSRATEVGVISEQRYAGGKRYYLFDPAATHEAMPEIDLTVALCVVVSPFDCFAVPVRIDETVWTAFLHVRECARWQLAGDSDLFGPALVPAKEVA